MHKRALLKPKIQQPMPQGSVTKRLRSDKIWFEMAALCLVSCTTVNVGLLVKPSIVGGSAIGSVIHVVRSLMSCMIVSCKKMALIFGRTGIVNLSSEKITLSQLVVIPIVLILLMLLLTILPPYVIMTLLLRMIGLNVSLLISLVTTVALQTMFCLIVNLFK